MNPPAHAPTRVADSRGAGLGATSALSGYPRRNSRGKIRSILESTPFLALVLTALAWPFSKAYLYPTSGLDTSWRGTLERSVALHMPYGTHVVFTYGPLGFLTVPALYESAAAVCAFLFAVALGVAIFGVLIGALRDVLPVPVAFVVAFVAGASLRLTDSGPEVLLAVVFALGVWLLSGRVSPDRWMTWLSLGAIAGAMPLIKLSTGAGVCAIVLIVLICLPEHRIRAFVRLLAGVVPTLLVGWFATGNGISNIVPYIKNAIPVVSGYSAAMALGAVDIGWQKWLWIVVVALVAALAWLHCQRLAWTARSGIAIMTAITLWLLAKEAFVRFDAGHEVAFFSFVPLLVVAFRPSVYPRALLVGGVAVSTLLIYLVVGSVPELVYRPDLAVRDLTGEALAFATGSQRHEIMASARAEMQDTYAVPSGMRTLMRGRSVDVDPWTQNVTWAYPGSTFDPLPVSQDYSAYTDSLDHLDASFLTSTHAPALILKQAPIAIDTRAPIFDPPLTQVAIECRYRQVAVTSSWQLVARTHNRCGAPQALSSTEMTHNRRFVPVPRPRRGQMVVATFILPSSFAASVEGLLLKPPEICMNAISSGNVRVSFRFVVGTSEDFHLLRPATTLGYSSRFSPPSIGALNFSNCGSSSEISGVHVTFYSIPMRAT